MEEVKNYEIAYLLPPSLTEEEVIPYVSKITSSIENNKGVLKHAETPKKRRLAYAVKKDLNAYFGWTTFSALSSSIKAIDKAVREEKGFSRFLIIDKTGEDLQFKPIHFPNNKISEATPTTENKTEEKTPEERLDLEALDKKLEEILGK